jgi:hypothetical protein
MLSGLEAKLTAVVADALAGRDDLTVEQAAGPATDPAAGSGVVRVAVTSFDAEAVFEAERQVLVDGGAETRSRRVAPVAFGATLRFTRKPATGVDLDAAAAEARRLLLDDLAVAGHALADERVRGGGAFAVAGDPGFEVRAFGLVTGTVAAEPDGGVAHGEIACGGRAIVWPPGPPADEGVIATVDLDVEPGDP